MKRLDEGRVSLVEFLASIRYARRTRSRRPPKDAQHFAHFCPQARAPEAANSEELSLVRSVN